MLGAVNSVFDVKDIAGAEEQFVQRRSSQL